MRAFFYLAALVLAEPLFGNPFGEATLQTAAELRSSALQGTKAFDWAEDLTTRVGPRMAGSEADARAVEWATTLFRSLDFDEVRTEPVTFPTWQRGIESAAVVSPAPQPLLITTLGFSPPTPEGGIEAEIVLLADYAALENVDPDLVADRIVFINHRMERSRDGSGYRPAVIARQQGPRMAAEKGAAALLIRSIGTGDHRFAHTGNIRYDPDAATPVVPAAALAHPDADQLERLVALDEPVIVRLELGPSYGEPYTSHNVIGEIRGSELPGEVVLIAAHLDSWDLSPGALDDAAGVGIVVETARRIIALDRAPRRTIRVVLFAAEEIGLLGARAYAEFHAGEVEQHLVGSESDFGAGAIYAFNARVAEEAWPVIEAIHAELEPLGIELGVRDAYGGPDMTPMRNRGMAVVDLAQDGTHYFDYHHTKDDTLDKIDPKDLDQNVAAWLVFTWLAANSPVSFGSGPGLIPGE